MKRFFRWQFLLTYLLIVTALGTTAYYAPKVFATSDFTATNVTFDPATGLLEWDYTGTPMVTSGASTQLKAYNTNTVYWQSFSPDQGVCTSSHCYTTLRPHKPDHGVTTIEIEMSGYSSQEIDYPLPLPSTYTSQNPSANTMNSLGWVSASETWTYASADDPTFTLTTSGDKTSKYTPGMKVKLVQSSAKYFIITGVSYSSPNTTITLYGGTDYDLSNAAISSPSYSMVKAPVGFPLDPNKWTVELSYSSNISQANPAAGTWYNLASLSLSIPSGLWNVEYHIPAYLTSGANTSTAQYTLSTSNSAESDADFTSILGGHGGSNAHGMTVTKSKTLSLTNKTTYYVIEKVDVTGGLLTLLGSYSPLKVRAVSAYL